MVHGEHGDGAWWAQHVKAGDPVALWGPRSVYRKPYDCSRVLLIGDETALPAMAAILESFEPGERAAVLVEVSDVDDRIPLESRAEVSVE